MACRDRTAEFNSVVRSLQSYHAVQTPRSRPTAKTSQVLQEARRIGYDINCTYAKLEKLTELAKMRSGSSFGDPASHIQELTQVIKQDIGKLNSDIGGLQQRMREQTYSENKHSRTHSSTVVVSLQSQLADMSKDFKSVLEHRTESLKQQKQRREQFSATPTMAPMVTTLSPFGGKEEGSVLLSGGSMNGTSDVSIDMDSVQKQSQLQLIDQQDGYIQERADAMQNIHSTIVELGTIFRQLAEMVKEQEEQVMRIDANVSETEINVESAHTELLKYFKGVTSNRWLMIKIFLVVMVFFVIFVIFLA
eukprot:Em0019g611a